MKFRKLGNTNVEVSAIGLGCMPISSVYGEADDNESIKLLDRALDLGINLWDTADAYDIDSSNEILLGKYFKKTGNRGKIFLASKFGFVLNEGYHDAFQPKETHIDGSPEYVKKACEASLKRLGIDCIDLYYLHRVDPNVPIEETVGAMADLIKEGKIRYIGLSECTLEDLKKSITVAPITAIQSEFSLLSQQHRGVMEFCGENNVGFIPFAPLSRGLMTATLNTNTLDANDFRRRLPRYQGEYLDNNTALAVEFGKFAESKNASATQLALAWVLAQGEHVIPIPGTKKIKNLENNVGCVDIDISADDLKVIDSLLEKYPNIGPRYSSNENKFVKKDK